MLESSDGDYPIEEGLLNHSNSKIFLSWTFDVIQLTYIWILKEIKVRRLELLGKLMLKTTPHILVGLLQRKVFGRIRSICKRLSSLVLQCIVKLLIMSGMQKMPYKSCFFKNISSRPQLKIFGYIFPKILCINTSDFQLILIYY